MMIPQLRRTLNDSSIGRRINGSSLGLYVEAISREISEHSTLERNRSIINCIYRSGSDFTEYLELCEQERHTKEDPQHAYSWTTPFYKKVRTPEGKEKMIRVPTTNVLNNGNYFWDSAVPSYN